MTQLRCRWYQLSSMLCKVNRPGCTVHLQQEMTLEKFQTFEYRWKLGEKIYDETFISIKVVEILICS